MEIPSFRFFLEALSVNPVNALMAAVLVALNGAFFGHHFGAKGALIGVAVAVLGYVFGFFIAGPIIWNSKRKRSNGNHHRRH